MASEYRHKQARSKRRVPNQTRAGARGDFAAVAAPAPSWRRPLTPPPKDVANNRAAVGRVTNGNPHSGATGVFLKYRGYSCVLTSLHQAPTPAQAAFCTVEFFGRAAVPQRSCPLLPKVLFEPVHDYGLLIVAIDSSCMKDGDLDAASLLSSPSRTSGAISAFGSSPGGLSAASNGDGDPLEPVPPLRPCKHMEELRLNEEFHSLLEVVAHPFGELKRVEHAAIRSADATSVWYLGQVEDGCHAAPVFFEDMWIGVHLQPSLSEPGRRCLRVDALFAETSSAVDTAADSRVARARDHPDLTILAATTFVGLTSHHRPQHHGDHSGHEADSSRAPERAHPLNHASRATQRAAILRNNRRRRCQERRRMHTDAVAAAEEERHADHVAWGPAQVTAMAKAVIDGNVEAMLRLSSAAGTHTVSAYRTADGRTFGHIAAAAGSLPALSSLAQLGCDLSASTESGDTVAHTAAYHGHVHALRFLGRRCPGTLNATNAMGLRPVDVAEAQHQAQVVQWFGVLGVRPPDPPPPPPGPYDPVLEAMRMNSHREMHPIPSTHENVHRPGLAARILDSRGLLASEASSSDMPLVQDGQRGGEEEALDAALREAGEGPRAVVKLPRSSTAVATCPRCAHTCGMSAMTSHLIELRLTGVCPTTAPPFGVADHAFDRLTATSDHYMKT